MKKEIKNFESYVADIDIAGDEYNVTFYDFPGCVSGGSTINESIKNAKIALQMHINGMLEDGDCLPEPTDIKDIITRQCTQGGTRQCTQGVENYDHADVRALIEVSIKRVKRKRIDITLNSNLIDRIDSKTNNRSKFIEEASIYYLNKHFK